MNRILAAGFALAVVASPAFAADAKIDDAVKTFEQVASDAAKLKTYCAMSKLMAETGEDEKKAQAAEPQIDGYLKELGPDFEAAWSAGEELDEKSPDAKTLNDALDKLDEKCPE